MRERQGRYSGICSVRESIFNTAFNELYGAVARDESRRGKTCTPPLSPPAAHWPGTPTLTLTLTLTPALASL